MKIVLNQETQLSVNSSNLSSTLYEMEQIENNINAQAEHVDQQVIYVDQQVATANTYLTDVIELKTEIDTIQANMTQQVNHVDQQVIESNAQIAHLDEQIAIANTHITTALNIIPEFQAIDYSIQEKLLDANTKIHYLDTQLLIANTQLTYSIDNVNNILLLPFETSSVESMRSIITDDQNQSIVIWKTNANTADSGLDAHMSKDFWLRGAPIVTSSLDETLFSTVNGIGLRSIITDKQDNTLLAWRTSANTVDSGLDAHMSKDFWLRGLPYIEQNITLSTNQSLSTTALHAITVNGQSLSVGGDLSDAGLTFNQLAAKEITNSTLMLQGTQRADGVPIVSIDQPRSVGYNTSIPATGVIKTSTGTAITASWPVAAAVNLYRKDLGLPLVPVVTGCHGISGIPIEDVDNDPLTGTGSLTIWSNLTFWYQQMAAVATAQGKKLSIPFHYWVHGTSAKSYPQGSYLTQLWKYEADVRALFKSIGIAGPATMLISQPGGNSNTSAVGDTWHVVDEVLQCCEAGGGVLTTPEYAYQIGDNNVHPDAFWTVQFAEVAGRAAAETEAGKVWTIKRPKVTIVGTTLILSYDSLRPNEHLVAHDASRYNGEGIDSWLGYEVTGASITNLQINGNTVVLTCSAVPTELKYAMQKQYCRGFANNKWNAHRGLMRTSDEWESKILPGVMLYRWLPSFKMTIS